MDTGLGGYGRYLDICVRTPETTIATPAVTSWRDSQNLAPDAADSDTTSSPTVTSGHPDTDRPLTASSQHRSSFKISQIRLSAICRKSPGLLLAIFILLKDPLTLNKSREGTPTSFCIYCAIEMPNVYWKWNLEVPVACFCFCVQCSHCRYQQKAHVHFYSRAAIKFYALLGNRKMIFVTENILNVVFTMI